MKKLPFTCDASVSQDAMDTLIFAHDNMANKIRCAILNAFNPDPNVCDEDKLVHLNPIAFQMALADAATELVGWKVDGLVEDIWRFAEGNTDNVV